MLSTRFGPGAASDEASSATAGLIHAPKRFNVAVTRAQALLLIVGDPSVLVRDACWRALLEACVEADGYRGCACEELGVYEEGEAGEGGGVDDFLEAVEATGALGAGCAALDMMYAYRDDPEWRVVL